MIDTLWIFARRNVSKHAALILQTTHPYLSGLLSFYLVYISNRDLRPYGLAGFFTPYDTIVFGFTATAIALAIAIPSRHFILFLSDKGENSTAYRDFLFVLAWNGCAHIFAFFLFIPFIFLGDHWVYSPANASNMSRFYVLMLLWIQFYSCFQFLVTTIAIFELADLYAQFSARERREQPTDEAS
jgi:hypothetical protein